MKTCTTCPSVTPLFDGKSCKECPANSEYSTISNTCRPCETGKAFSKTTLKCECADLTPFWDGFKCIGCYLPKYFDLDTKACKECPPNQYFDVTYKVCRSK